MGSVLRCLVLENELDWQSELAQTLRSLGGPVEVDVAATLEEARPFLGRNVYEMATVDLSLLGDTTDPQKADELGLFIVREILDSPRSRDTAILVVTGYPTPERFRRVLREHRVFDALDKHRYDRQDLLTAARAALLDARLRRVERQERERYVLTIDFGPDSLLGCELRGPASGRYSAERPVPLATSELTRRADQISLLLLAASAGLWREEADALGRDTYDALQQDRRLAIDLTRARELSWPSRSENPLWLQMNGPSTGLGVPFELMRDANDYLCFDHILTRKVSHEGLPLSRKEPFHRFLAGLRPEPLRVLLVGASDIHGRLTAVDQEIAETEAEIRLETSRLGLPVQIETLTGERATWKNVREALQEGGFHLFHYAGHSCHKEALPEAGGLVLLDEDRPKILSAADLKLIASGTPLQLVVLNSCLGARTERQIGRSDFQGTMEALARADVPVVLGHRWTVTDGRARELSRAFYRALWQHFSPGRALLDARRAMSAAFGRDDKIWASTVLLCQTDPKS